MRKSVVFCESKTHVAMLLELQRSAAIEVESVLTSCPLDGLSQIDRPVTQLRFPSGSSPKQQWLQAHNIAKTAVRGRALIQFQDQGWTAQAVSAAAREVGAHRTLIQDGYLSFDLQHSFGPRRWLWPVTSRLDRISLQTPRPRLRSRLNSLLYQQHFFGITRPEKLLVQGNAMKTRVVQQHQINPDSIWVVPPVMGPESLRDRHAPIDTERPLRVLFLDQCFLRYRRMSERSWRQRYLPLVENLSAFDLTVKLHPSQTDEAAQEVISAAGENATILGTHRLAETLDHDVDVAVTVSSTAFLSCLASGVPVIFCDSGGLDRMPTFNHPLVANTDQIEATAARLQTFQHSGVFPGNKGGDPLEEHVCLGDRKLIPQALAAE